MVRFDLTLPGDIRFGAGRVSEVPGAFADLGANRVMVITGRTTSRADGIRAAAAQKRLARGRAHRQRRVRVLKHDAFPREGVEVRGFYAPKPSIAHAVMPKLVGIDQQDIHIVRCG